MNEPAPDSIDTTDAVVSAAKTILLKSLSDLGSVIVSQAPLAGGVFLIEPPPSPDADGVVLRPSMIVLCSLAHRKSDRSGVDLSLNAMLYVPFEMLSEAEQARINGEIDTEGLKAEFGRIMNNIAGEDADPDDDVC